MVRASVLILHMGADTNIELGLYGWFLDLGGRFLHCTAGGMAEVGWGGLGLGM